MSNILIVFLLITTNSLITIGLKVQDSSDMLNIEFSHPFYQTFIMFFAQTFCYLPYYFCYQKHEKTSPDKKKLTFKQTFIPSFCDLCSTTLLYISLTLLPVFFFQMLRGTSLLVQTFFSVVFNKKKLTKHEFIGILSMFFGTLLIAATNPKNNDSEFSIEIAGILLLYGSLVLNAIQNSYEEYAVKSFEIHSLKFVAYEGFWGVSIYSLILIAFQNVRCYPDNNKSSICTVNRDGVWLLENTTFAVEQVFSEFKFIALQIMIMICTASYNTHKLTYTKFNSFLAKTIIVNARVVVVWCVFLIFGNEKFQLTYLIGYIMITLGVFIFNEVINISLLNDFFRYIKRCSLCFTEEFIRRSCTDRSSMESQFLGNIQLKEKKDATTI